MRMDENMMIEIVEVLKVHRGRVLVETLEELVRNSPWNTLTVHPIVHPLTI